MLQKRIGIDLGTDNVRVFVQGQGLVLSEPAVVAVGTGGSRILAVGSRARDTAAGARGTAHLVRPVRDGGIADAVVAAALIQHLVDRVAGRQRVFRPDVTMAVPLGVTALERRVLVDAATAAGARQAWLVDAPMAAAIGAGIDVAQPDGAAVCDIGGGTVFAAVIARSAIVVAGSMRYGGDRLDDAIAAHLRRHHAVGVTAAAAEKLKIAAGSARAEDRGPAVTVTGRDIRTGEVRTVAVGPGELAAALRDPLDAIGSAIAGVLDQAPREMAARIRLRGLILTGGGSLLRGIGEFLGARLALPVSVAADPEACVARGTGMASEHLAVYKRNQLYMR